MAGAISLLGRWVGSLAAGAVAYVLASMAGQGMVLAWQELGVGSGDWLWLLERVVVGLAVAHLVFRWRAWDQGELGAAGFGVLVGAIFFMLVLNRGWLDPGNTSWLNEKRPELQLAQEAWTAYRSDPWSVPVGAAGDGSTLLTAGAVPLMSVLAKAADPWLPTPAQYVGLWLCLSYCLQGAFGGLLMRCLTPDARIQMLGTVFFVLSAPLLNSMGHPGAAAHWVLLAGLWLYFRTWGTLRHGWLWPAWIFLVVLSMAIHGQLAVMTFLLALTFTARLVWVDRTLHWAPALLRVLLLLICVAGAGYLLGYTGSTTVTGMGSGEANRVIGSMNLLGPLDSAGWSRFLRPLGRSAVEPGLGFNYVGLGVLLLASWCLLMVLMRPLDPAGLRPWAPLLVLAAVLGLMALLPEFAVGRHVLLGAAMWPELAEHELLRASGRYFWLVGYAFLFLLIALVVHAHPPRRALLLLGLALALQEADLSIRHLTIAQSNRIQTSVQPGDAMGSGTGVLETLDGRVGVP